MGTTAHTVTKPVDAASQPRRRRMWRTQPASDAEIQFGPLSALALTLWFGLLAGFLVLSGELVFRAIWGETAWLGRYQMNRHYLWMIPATTVLISGLFGPVLALLAWFRPRNSFRPAATVLCTLLALCLLLEVRFLEPWAALVLGLGIGASLGRFIDGRSRQFVSRALRTLPALVCAAGVLTAFSFGRDAWREHRALSVGRSAPPGAPNVLLIVLDATRADALSPYGSKRDTSPNLSRLARAGVVFDRARSTSPWTLPSHASMFTGRWPHELNVSQQKSLGSFYPTLADALRRRGYATGGFVGNYAFCSEGYGLNRGFSRYAARPISLDDLLSCTGIGRRLLPAVDWLRESCMSRVNGRPWFNSADRRYITHDKTAAEVNQEFLTWIAGSNDRPFFAFLNYFDVHGPYLTPREWTRHFGVVPRDRADLETLRYWERDWHVWNHNHRTDVDGPSPREVELARDAYDDCIAYMDHEIGRLMDELERRGVLSNTLVIVAADHGEGFGEHKLFCHYVSVHRSEIDVPLLISMPARLPQGVRVAEPVSLRSIPATVMDLLQLGDPSAPSRFPGRSLARHWNPSSSDSGPSADEPVLSELEELGLQALMEQSKIYIHHDDGMEQLFDIASDPGELVDLSRSTASRADLERLRSRLAAINASSRPVGTR